MFTFQGPMCTLEQTNCVERMKGSLNSKAKCDKSCNGLMITSHTEKELDKDSFKDIRRTVNQCTLGGRAASMSVLIHVPVLTL